MFLWNAWYIAAWDTEVEGGRPLARRILDKPLVLFRGESGKIIALDDRCPHRAALLSMGQREGDSLRCMYHGLLFDGTGQCVEVPGQDVIPRALQVKSYPVIERSHLIWIWMGEPERADPIDIPDTHWHNGPKNVARDGYIRYGANYQFIADNLLDFSHLAFVHSNSLGSSSQAATKAQVQQIAEGVQVAFITLGGKIPAFARLTSQLPDIVDRYQYYEWRIKSCFFSQNSMIGLPGEPFDGNDPLSVRINTINVLTPETATSTHFFWSIAHSNFNPADPTVTDKLRDLVGGAFDEDRAMIEGQQRSVLDNSEDKMIAIPADNALIRARRMLSQLLSEESGSLEKAMTDSLQ